MTHSCLEESSLPAADVMARNPTRAPESLPPSPDKSLDTGQEVLHDSLLTQEGRDSFLGHHSLPCLCPSIHQGPFIRVPFPQLPLRHISELSPYQFPLLSVHSQNVHLQKWMQHTETVRTKKRLRVQVEGGSGSRVRAIKV